MELVKFCFFDLLSREDNNCVSTLFTLTFQGIQWLHKWNINKQKQKKILSSSNNYIICSWFLNNTTIITFPLILCWHHEVTSRNSRWFFMMAEERTEFTGWCERSLWSKIAKFVFLPLLITKHLTPLTNSLVESWEWKMQSRKLQDEETGSHCLSSWLLSWSYISGAQARAEMTKKKKYNRFLCTFSSVLDSGPDTSSVWKTETEHGCLRGDESLAVLHTGNDMCENTRDFPPGFIFLVLPLFGRRKSIKLGALDLHPQGWTLKWHSFCDSILCCLERNCTGNERQRFLWV